MSTLKMPKVETTVDPERIFLDHYDWLLKKARQLHSGDKAAAEDLVQDLYVRFVQSSSQPDTSDPDRLRGYLYKTLEHLYISESRRNGNDPLSNLTISDFDSVELAIAAVDRSRLLFIRSDKGVVIHAMHKEAAARITRRSVQDIERLGREIPPMSYDVRDYARLGILFQLLHVEDPMHPTQPEVEQISRALQDAINDARGGNVDLGNRLESAEAKKTRQAGIHARNLMEEQWGRELGSNE